MSPATSYFAYGSNLDPEQMACRCPGASVEGPATLAAHRFIVARQGYGSVLPDPAGTVYGVVWRLTEADERALDEYEGVPERMYGKAFMPVRPQAGGEPVEALIYIARDPRPGTPQPGYIETVVRAARRHGFPPTYLAELEHWVPVTGA